MVIQRKFFQRPAQRVARDLLGKVLVRRLPDGSKLSVCITETEAYGGPQDKASHARFGVSTKSGRTKRNALMYEEGGVWYAYFVYGAHWMLNVVTGKKENPQAVLIRVGVLLDAAGNHIRRLRGPGVVARAVGITGKENGEKISRRSGLWIEERGVYIPARQIVRAPRVGVPYAGEWAHKKWRFVWVHPF